ncbi:hypothetical protein BH11GEM1_BH11GEM1_00010 [soil metagenome]
MPHLSHWRLVAPALLVVAPLHAQATGHAVRGTVFDSVAHVALNGAVIQLARIASGDTAPHITTSISDGDGRYQFAGLPNGRYAIGFQHDALNALGIESPLRAFELGPDSTVTVDLGIESGPRVRAERCGKDAGGPSEGMLTGFVLDAAHDAPAVGARVELHWIETALQRSGFRSVPKDLVATITDDGRYLACGVPSDTPIGVVASQDGARDVTGQVTIPLGGAMRQDFVLPLAGTTQGSATITGRVMQQDSSAMQSGVVSLDALAIDTPVRNGTFSLGSIPAGTWFIEVKAIGYEPRSLLVQATSGPPAPVLLVLDKKAQTLEAVSVIGKASPNTRTLNDIVERSRTATGTVFLPGSSWLESANVPADVLRAAVGFRYIGGDSVEGRLRCGKIAVYLDGLRMMSLSQLTNAVPMKKILAIEAYPDITTAPFIYRMQVTAEHSCAVVAAWTKH